MDNKEQKKRKMMKWKSFLDNLKEYQYDHLNVKERIIISGKSMLKKRSEILKHLKEQSCQS